MSFMIQIMTGTKTWTKNKDKSKSLNQSVIGKRIVFLSLPLHKS